MPIMLIQFKGLVGILYIYIIVIEQSTEAYQLLAHGRWFSPGTLASSTTKASRHDIAEILLKVALNTTTLTPNPISLSISVISLNKQIIRFAVFCDFIILNNR
jgi:hypothetical protein